MRKKLYDMDVIYPKYRSIIPVTMFLEYLESGRCDSLTGPHGAYNLYEQEIRGNMIIAELGRVRSALYTISSQLGTISSQLGRMSSDLATIKNNQYLLYQAVEQSNDVARKISDETAAIAGNTSAMRNSAAWTAYNSAVTARCSQTMERLMNFEHTQKYGIHWKLNY